MEARDKLDRIAAGYQDAFILLTSLRLGVFDALASGPLASAELAARLGLDARALDLVLHALAAVGILVKEGESFRLEAGCAPLLVAGSPDTMASIYRHHDRLSGRWIRLEETLRTGRPVPREGADRSPSEHRDYICGMENVSRDSSRDVAAAVDFSGARRLLDVGGGPGTASLVFAAANPGLSCVVFDLPETTAIAREMIAAAGLGDRVATVDGDFHVDGFGEGFDVVYVSNIIHMLPPRDTAMIARKAHAALVPGGRLMFKDFYLDDTRTAPAHAARFSVNMLVGTEGGMSYTMSQTRDIMAEAGFGGFTVVPAGQRSLVVIGVRS
ncbi:MAG: SAM-dependent methyltransferase [Gemmatimonas sp.]|nr:SAM-dependent methyltransferase [Gemmatimonas sp.]